jgi:phage/plasmid-like protein (TIGR03299 family)
MARITPDATLPDYAPDSRSLPWNVMGGALRGDYTDVQSALIEQGMNYDTRTVPVFAQPQVDDEGRSVGTADLPANKHRAVVRPGPGGMGEMVVGVVGTRFRPIQNRDAFAVADLLVSEFGAKITGAADFRNGGASLLVVDLQRPVVLDTPDGGQDVTDLDLLIRNSHDGSSALTFALTGARIACTNMVQAAIPGARRSWKISHTPNAQQRVDLARQAIVASLAYQDAFQVQAQAMIDQTMSDLEFDKIVARLWPVAEGREDTKAGERALEIRSEVRSLYRESQTIESVRGTLWGGYNAITEWFDWGRPVRDGDVSRAEGALEGPYVRRKSAVWDLFSSAVR